MSFGKIYSYPNNPRVFKALVAAKLNNLDVAYPQDFQMGVTNTTEDFKSKFPTTRVPAFEGADGVNLFDSDAIAQYIAESGPQADRLLGSNPAERATIRQWIAYASSDFMPLLTQLVLPRMGITKYDTSIDEKYLPMFHKQFKSLDAFLEKRKYLTSEKEWNMADVSLVAALWWSFAFIAGEEERQQYPALMRWFKSVTEDDVVKSVFGEVKYTDKIVIPQ
ncbi:translation elongation factor eEF-1B gamma subunit [Ascosphaera apis ARSEF 7405]|uniref:Translation elongation factor eEF-1B gamma subunit n=1 Tax=Ascosphaera apis ARSEF 7405 TaxID=392613 RepID=A0A167WJA9_9EURO|nr:translation elongation factor eEF-1B gamma subunit [Ascosphaera apis ARSEF 7405]